MPDDPAFEAPEDADSITDWRAEPSYDSLFAFVWTNARRRMAAMMRARL